MLRKKFRIATDIPSSNYHRTKAYQYVCRNSEHVNLCLIFIVRVFMNCVDWDNVRTVY